MNPELISAVGTLARLVIGMIAGGLVTHGLIKPDDASAFISSATEIAVAAIPAVAAYLWSRRAHAKTKAQASAAPVKPQ